MTTFWPAAIAHAPQLGVALRGPAHVHDRAHPPQQLLDRGREPRVEVLGEPRQLLRVGEERVHAAGHEVARRVAAGVDEQQEEEVEVDDVELVTVDGRVGDEAGEVVGGLGPPGLPDAVRVVEHLDHAPSSRRRPPGSRVRHGWPR